MKKEIHLLTDLSNAFDCLPHKMLILKLIAYGFSHIALKLMYSYISDRKKELKEILFTIHGKIYCLTIRKSRQLGQHLHRGCSYGGKLARVGGLAHLSEISLSLRNSYKNIMCSVKSEPAGLVGISLDLAGIPPR